MRSSSLVMRSARVLPIAGLLAALGPQIGRAAPQQDAPRRNIVILATGGTIAGAGTGGAGYTAGQFKVEDLIAAVPGMDKLANLKGEQVANIGSQDMNDQVWLKLAERVNQLVSRPDVDGIVITHGTDTMEETAYFLNLVVKSEKPVVLAGSMRPATAVSADGPGNLLDAVATAADPKAAGRGVLVVMNDTIHNARDVVKMNTTSLDTFASPNRGPAGSVVEGEKVTWFERTDKRHTSDSEFSVAGRMTLPRVDIIYAHSNMDDSLIDDAIRDGAKGLVIAGVGDGNMPKAALDAIAKAAKQGVVVVRSTRLPTGAVLRNAEVKDDELGLVASGELNPAKSRVLLQLALTRGNHSAADVQRMFREY
jgi:L-asparaginase